MKLHMLSFFDGVMLTKLEYQAETFPHWKQFESNMDMETVSLIGDAIEKKLT